jgi:hypothetical protein
VGLWVYKRSPLIIEYIFQRRPLKLEYINNTVVFIQYIEDGPIISIPTFEESDNEITDQFLLTEIDEEIITEN